MHHISCQTRPMLCSCCGFLCQMLSCRWCCWPIAGCGAWPESSLSVNRSEQSRCIYGTTGYRRWVDKENTHVKFFKLITKMLEFQLKAYFSRYSNQSVLLHKTGFIHNFLFYQQMKAPLSYFSMRTLEHLHLSARSQVSFCITVDVLP